MRDDRGVSAVEFAYIFPLLVLLYVGAVETGNLLTIYRRTLQIASTASDLTAQVKCVTTANLADIVSASTSIMTPYSTTPLTIVITSVVADANNNGKVAWSYASKGAADAVNSLYQVPAGLTEPGSSVIVAKVTYTFTPLLGINHIGPYNLNFSSLNIIRKFYTRPRKSATVSKTDPTC